MQFLIEPKFVNSGNGMQIQFPANAINEMARSDYIDDWNYFQRTFGVYGNMTLRKFREFVLQKIAGHPIAWQALNSCDFDGTKTTAITSESITPTRLKLNELFCNADDFGGDFEHFYNYLASGASEMDEYGVQKINMLIKELTYMALLGLRAQCAVGKVHNASTPDGGLSVDLAAAWGTTKNLVTGWLQGFIDAGGNLANATAIIQADLGADGSDHADGFISLYDEVFDTNASTKLKSLVNRGGYLRNGVRYGANVTVSPTVFNWVVKAYNDESETAMTNGRRITRERVTDTSSGDTPVFQYYIDNSPIVILEELNSFDDYVDEDIYFIGIVASGVIQIGTSFDILDGTDSVGLIVQHSKDAADWGTTRVLAHGLAKSVLTDSELACGAYFIGNPA